MAVTAIGSHTGIGKDMKRWAKAEKKPPPMNWRLAILLWVLTEYLKFRFVSGWIL